MLTRPIPPLAGPRLTIRTALIAGFVMIFALALGFAWDLDRRLEQLEHRETEVQERHTERDGLLLTVAGQVLLGSVYVRDAMLAGDPETSTHFLTEMEEARARIERALQEYLNDEGSEEEREHWMHLREELERYWVAMLPTLAPDAARDSQAILLRLRYEVVPRRRTIIELSERIRTLNRETYNQQAAEVSTAYQVLRADVWRAGALFGVLAIVIAAAATRYAGSLEWRLRRQQSQLAEQTHQVQRLSDQLVRAQEEERRTVARELHDEVGQALTAVKLELAHADKRRRAGDTSDTLLDDARTMTENALHAVRDVSQLLNPSLLDTLGLPVTLDGYITRFAERTGINTTLTGVNLDDIDERLDPEVEICAYRVVQEALTNVAKHARASSCQVKLARDGDRLIVEVVDDGQGIDETTPGTGLGLVGIRERAAALGGTFAVKSTAGQGTRVVVSVPVRVPADTGAPGGVGARSSSGGVVA